MKNIYNVRIVGQSFMDILKKVSDTMIENYLVLKKIMLKVFLISVKFFKIFPIISLYG